MKLFGRTDSTIFALVWKRTDHWLFFTLALLLLAGFALLSTSYIPYTKKIVSQSADSIYLLLFFYFSPIFIWFFFCLIPVQKTIFVAKIIFGIIVVSLFVVFFGEEINGTHRWIRMGSLSIQPSEFAKPFFIIVTASLLSDWSIKQNNKYLYSSIGLCILLFALVFHEPDVGQSLLILSIWMFQLILTGIPGLVIVLLFIILSSLVVAAYFLFPHAQDRIEKFLNSDLDHYQVERSLSAVAHGGWFGTGPGEGTVKLSIPYAHTDFIFAVGVEEFGVVGAILILILFSIIFFRTVLILLRQENLFIVLSCSALSLELLLQAMINMCSVLNIIPPKGMTLPFISYGNSSLFSHIIGMGFLLSYTRRKIWSEDEND